MLSLGVWLRPHVPGGPAMVPALIAAATLVTAPATSRNRAASLIRDGLSAMGNGEMQAAAATFRKASDLASDDALAWTNLGMVQSHAAEMAGHYRAYLAHGADDGPGRTTVAARLAEVESRRRA